jgi:hypothetical protein
MRFYNRILLLSLTALCISITSSQCLAVNINNYLTTQDESGECYILDDKEMESVGLNTDEVDAVTDNIPDLITQLESKSSYRDFLRTLVDFSDVSDDETGVMRYIFDLLDEHNSFNLMEKRVFIISYGKTKLQNPLKGFQVNLLRPSIILWYYPGLQFLIKDKTIIIDPNPFNIRVLDGRQIGLMQGFIGVYIFIPGSSGYNTVFFIGYAKRVLALDLSPTIKLK